MHLATARPLTLHILALLAALLTAGCGGTAAVIQLPPDGKAWWPPVDPRQPHRLVIAQPGISDPLEWWSANILSLVPADAYSDTEHREFCEAMIVETNATRASYGLPPVTVLPVLNRVAQAHAVDLCTRDYWSHTTPEGLGSRDRIKAAGGGTVSLGGENSSINTPGAGTPVNVVNGWEHHTGHRELLLDPKVKFVGAGMDYYARNEFARYVLLLVDFAP